MDPSPWNIPLRYDCAGLLGSFAIPLSSRGPLHHPVLRDSSLAVEARQLRHRLLVFLIRRTNRTASRAAILSPRPYAFLPVDGTLTIV